MKIKSLLAGLGMVATLAYIAPAMADDMNNAGSGASMGSNTSMGSNSSMDNNNNNNENPGSGNNAGQATPDNATGDDDY